MSKILKNLLIKLSVVSAALISLPVFAQVSVSNAWVRGTVQGQTGTGAFLTLHAHQAANLLSVSSPIARVVEVHEMKMDGDVMRMRSIKSLPLPAMKNVELKPGGYHIMLMELKQPLKVGETVPLTLTFEQGGKKVQQTVKAEVRDLTTDAKQGAHHH